tara:strand:- start:90 stop:428 length:339 start_codon:yes stop_codon:yes gene_type:complete
MSSESISLFSDGKTTKSDIFRELGSPSIEIIDVNDVWIYLISLKEKKVFEQDVIQFQNIFKFEFDDNSILMKKSLLTQDDFTRIQFSSDKTRVRRDAYGITDQLYDAFTRGQ